MTQPVQTCVPAKVTAGDTLTWLITLGDYLASTGWVLKYRFINATQRIDVVSTPSGNAHSVLISAATSAAWVAGTYSYQAYVDGVSSQRFTVQNGTMIITPNLAIQAAGYDTRSSAKKLLDILNEDLATYGNKAYTQQYEIAGRKMSFVSPGEFLAFRSKIQAEVNREISQERIARGKFPRNKVLVRFGR